MPKEWLPFPFLSPLIRFAWRKGLADRAELTATLEKLIGQDARFCILLFGIDRFRLVNHRYGCAAADGVLAHVGAAACRFLGRRGRLGRWAGDEFLAILPGADTLAGHRIAEELRDRIAHLIIPAGNGVTSVTCSFGLACHPENGDLDALITAADEALYEAKRTGRNRIVPAVGLACGVHRIGSLVEAALREERIVPAYQPIVELSTRRRVAEEALARLLTTDDLTLEAHTFIDAADQLALTHRIDQVVIAAVIARARARPTNLPVFVNISGGLLRQPQILHELLQPTPAKGYPTRLVIEITERELLGDVTMARRLLAPFVEQGVQLALDDFGSGYSSFEYLADLPVSYLKIDSLLVQRLGEPRVRTIVRGIQRTAEELGLVTLAEGVEQERQVEWLREIGVHWAQGYHFSRARVDENEASARRRLSVNWAQGYYYRRPRAELS